MTAASPEPTSTDLSTFRGGDADTMLAAAEAAVRAYCGWHIYPVRTDDVVTVNGSGRMIQPLPTLHLTAVSQVVEVTTENGTDTSTTLTPGTDYDWSEAGYLTRTRYGWARPWTAKPRGVTATVTHGYDTCPGEVRTVILGLASRGVDSPAGGGVDMAGPFRFTPASNGDGSTGGVVLGAFDKAVLDRYRIPSRP